MPQQSLMQLLINVAIHGWNLCSLLCSWLSKEKADWKGGCSENNWWCLQVLFSIFMLCSWNLDSCSVVCLLKLYLPVYLLENSVVSPFRQVTLTKNEGRENALSHQRKLVLCWELWVSEVMFTCTWLQVWSIWRWIRLFFLYTCIFILLSINQLIFNLTFLLFFFL